MHRNKIYRYPGRLRTGAGGQNRTDDLLITNQLLYQLSYTGNRRKYKTLLKGEQ